MNTFGRKPLLKVEIEAVRECMKRTSGDRILTARILGIDQRRLRHIINYHCVEWRKDRRGRVNGPAGDYRWLHEWDQRRPRKIEGACCDLKTRDIIYPDGSRLRPAPDGIAHPFPKQSEANPFWTLFKLPTGGN